MSSLAGHSGCADRHGEASMVVTVRIAACKGSMNEECLVSVLQHSTLNTSLLFVHTARRIKELNRDNEAAGR